MDTQSVSTYKDIQKILAEIRRFKIKKIYEVSYYKRIHTAIDLPNLIETDVRSYLIGLIKRVQLYRTGVKHRPDNWNALNERHDLLRRKVKKVLDSISYSNHPNRRRNPKITEVNVLTNQVSTTYCTFICDKTWREFAFNRSVVSKGRAIARFFSPEPHDRFEVWSVNYLEQGFPYRQRFGYAAFFDNYLTIGYTMGGTTGAMTRIINEEVSNALL